jgi:hypothetical protein
MLGKKIYRYKQGLSINYFKNPVIPKNPVNPVDVF